MNRRKFSSVLVAMFMIAVILNGCTGGGGGTDKGKALKVAMVTDKGGINDLSFNQSSWEGLQKAKKDLGVEVSFMESSQESDYSSNLENLYDQGNDLIFGIGNTLGDKVKEAADTNTEQKYSNIDFAYDEPIPKNLLGITFRDQEPAFLVGYIAGKMTKTNKVGFVGGMEISVIFRFESGFMAGVKTANKDCEVIVQYAGDWGDTAKGKAIANQMYQNGADIIFHAAGYTGTGVIEAAEENKKYVIGVDKDQKAIMGKNSIITSAVKKVDQAIYSIVKDLKEGKWAGGTNIEFGLTEGAVGIAPTSKDSVPQEILDEVSKLEKDIVAGKVKVPASREEFKKMFP